MARAPYGTDIYNQGDQFPTQAGAGDARVSVGGGVNIGDLTGLVDIPMLDASGPANIGRGVAQLGQGISNLGDTFFKLAEMQAKAINVKRVSENERAMTAMAFEIEAAQDKEPDETKWGDIAKTMIGKLPELPANLSPDARDHIDARRAEWQANIAGTTQVRSVKKSVRDADADLDAQRKNAIDRQDLESANRIADEQGKLGARSPAEIEALKNDNATAVEQVTKKAHAAALDGYKNEVISLAETHPPDVVKAYIENNPIGRSIAPDEKRYLLGVAEQVQRDKTSELSDSIVDGIVAHGMVDGKLTGIWNTTMLDAAIGGSPFVSPKLRQTFLDMMERRNSKIENEGAEKQKQLRDSPEGVKNFYKAFHEAAAWAPDKQDESSWGDYAEKIAWIRDNVRGDLQNTVVGMLQTKMSVTGGARKKSSETDPVMAVVTNRIGDAFAKDMKDANASLEMLTQSRKSETDPQVIAVKAKMDDYVEMQANLKIEMKEWREANPQATSKDAVKHYNTLVPVKNSIMDADAISSDGAKGASGPRGEAGFLGDTLINMVKDLEGFSANPFGDYKQTSIGYGTRAKKGDAFLTREQADQRLREELAMHARRIDESAQKSGYQLTDAQRDALISFDFNTGKGAYLLESSDGDLDRIAKRMRTYRIAGGKVNKGLINRRSKEINLFTSET